MAVLLADPFPSRHHPQARTTEQDAIGSEGNTRSIRTAAAWG